MRGPPPLEVLGHSPLARADAQAAQYGNAGAWMMRAPERESMSSDAKTHVENAKAYRAKATELAETVRTTRSLRQGSEARKSQKAYAALADNEEWLAQNSDKVA